MTAATFLHGVEVIQADAGPRPITTVSSAVIGLVGTAPGASATDFPLNTPVLIAGSRTAAALLRGADGKGAGSLPDAVDSILDQGGALMVVVRVAEGETDAETLAAVQGQGSDYSGVFALLHAESAVGYTPRLLLAPGFTDFQATDANGVTLANPVVQALKTVAAQLKAIAIADAPDTTTTEATAYATRHGSDRLYVVYPKVLRTNKAGAIVAMPASSCIAGVMARTDYEQGFWKSPSNEEILNIIGTSQNIEFNLSSPTSQANVLNEGNVTTIVRQAGRGFRVWGNHTSTTDTRYQFVSVRRTADIINDSVVRAHIWAVDQGITKNYVSEVVEGVNAYLRELKALGAIIDGRCWCDPDLNPASQVQKGIVVFSFDFTPPYSAEHVIFRSQLTNAYITEIF